MYCLISIMVFLLFQSLEPRLTPVIVSSSSWEVMRLTTPTATASTASSLSWRSSNTTNMITGEGGREYLIRTRDYLTRWQ